MNKLEQYIKTLQLPSRTDCPICGHKNTFSASVLDGFIIYNCFHASCKTRGKLPYDLSLNDVRNFDSNRLRPLQNLQRQLTSSSNASSSTSLEWSIPDYFTNPLQNARCLAFIRYWRLLDLYIDRKISLYFDAKQNRCVFILKDFQGRICGATGRNLTYPTSIRWLIYTRLFGCPFIVGTEKGTKVLIVEDCISACIGSSICSSIALLGTSIPEATIKYLLGYDTVYIALDRDATSKAIKLQKQLSPYIKNVIVIPLEKDLKYYSKDELEALKI